MTVGSLFLRIFSLHFKSHRPSTFMAILSGVMLLFTGSKLVLKFLGLQNDPLGLFDSKSQLDRSEFGYNMKR